MSARQNKAYIRVAKRDLTLASVRYRGLLPGCALQDAGWDVRVGTGSEKPPAGTDLVIVVKPLSERDANWVRDVGAAGPPVIVDLCDNVFIDGYANQGQLIGQRFVATCHGAAAITVPTAALRDVVSEHAGWPADQVHVVPDIVETQSLLSRQRALLDGGRHWKQAFVEWVRQTIRAGRIVEPARPVLLWFGNHGATYANFGMHDLLLFRDALEQAARRHDAELWVVSNSENRFNELAPQLPIRSCYFEWNPTVVDELLQVASVCLVPNSLDGFSATKSANRALKALSARVPVVATRTPAYAGMENAMWLGDPADGVLGYLRDRGLRDEHLCHAARTIEAQFSMASLRHAMNDVVRAIGSQASSA